MTSSPILLVEADPVAGLDLMEALEAAGYRVTGPARTAAEAQAWLARANPALAVLDLAIVDGAATQLARTLRRRGVPFLVCTDGESRDRLPEFADVPCLTKPAWHRDVVGTMDDLAARTGRFG